MLFSKGLLPKRRRPAWRQPRIVFDLSRLLSRAYHTTPTGIDRVELAYAMELLRRVPDRLRFSAVHPAGGYYGRLELGAVRQFLAFTQARWQTRAIATPEEVRAQAIRHLFSAAPARGALRRRDRASTFRRRRTTSRTRRWSGASSKPSAPGS